ncbi:hypothetical protein FXO38_29107 [Capsicum annuum]|nr:hypothetical protein FXO38_29107 [Capsicum annuum]
MVGSPASRKGEKGGGFHRQVVGRRSKRRVAGRWSSGWFGGEADWSAIVFAWLVVRRRGRGWRRRRGFEGCWPFHRRKERGERGEIEGRVVVLWLSDASHGCLLRAREEVRDKGQMGDVGVGWSTGGSSPASMMRLLS